MSDTAQTRQFHYIAPPTYGGVTRLQANTTPAVLDLTTIAGWPGNQVSAGSGAGPNNADPNPIGHYLSLEVDSGTLYIVFADTFAHANAIDTTTVSTTSGTTGAASATFTAKGATAVLGGAVVHYWIPPGINPQTTPFGANSVCRYMGYICAANTVNFIVRQSSH